VSGPDLDRLLEEAWAERDKLREEVERLRVVESTLRMERDLFVRKNDEAKEERDRLRAVLAETPENVAAVIASIEHPEAGPRDVVWDGARVLAALRAKAGLR
jgi:uncharacterized coiled-coil DUF342 family protein